VTIQSSREAFHPVQASVSLFIPLLGCSVKQNCHFMKNAHRFPALEC
jgi:hypothetical protein